MTARARESRRILLLGRHGQLGFELERTLSTLGDVIACGRADCDLADAAALAAAIEAARPDLIVNAAAYTAVDAAEDDEATAFAINAIAPAALAAAARRLGIALVHFSTDYVFDGAPATRADGTRPPYDEAQPVAPQGAYGRSKLAGEETIRLSGCAHFIFRTAWVYANRGRNFLNTMERLASERDRLSIVDDQIGNPTWARSLAEATAQILALSWAQGSAAALERVGGTYHLACTGAASWFQFAHAIFAHWGDEGRPVPQLVPITTPEYPTRAKRPAWSVLDCKKAYATFGVQLPGWQAALALCLAERPS
ncbi:MAG: dTDP-4-dehydrorhamnose reductase [Defluviicoccus sp.]|nr:dTDP-4-dehydrorhamnose reductase [Defluviicoccus sp.]MDG4593868.1 dTDP-4-dehydrorhamnose reductase [Defluviicoccus sp.]MDS4010243.1 dTDP-4-dehydrorhamnose reductase [Defluviicoccus sp.]MDS4073586.1 dTDP-4-dehydrorhamnose reductase [Defluviicoccus sp.]